MSNIDKQALRSKARSASAGEWIKESGDGWEAICSTNDQANGNFIIAHFEGPDARANREFAQAANPDTVLALLDELEAAEHTAAVDHEAACSLVEENEEVKRKLEVAEKCITELLSENAGLNNSVENAAGCINAAYAEGLIDVLSESNDDRLVDLVKRRLLFAYLPIETPATNEELIAMGDWVLREQLEDGTRAIKTLNRRIAELRDWNLGLAQESFERQQRIAELSGQKRLIGWRASDYTDETSDPELAKNWAAAIGVLPIFEGDVNTKLSAAGIGKGE